MQYDSNDCGLQLVAWNSMTFLTHLWHAGAGSASFSQSVEKTVFSMVKTGLAKVVFAGKNSFWH